MYPDEIVELRRVTGYPGGEVLDAHKVKAGDQNNMADVVEAIEDTLGLNPEGAFTDVAARLTDIEGDTALIPNKYDKAGGEISGDVTIIPTKDLIVADIAGCSRITNTNPLVTTEEIINIGSNQIQLQARDGANITRLEVRNNAGVDQKINLQTNQVFIGSDRSGEKLISTAAAGDIKIDEDVGIRMSPGAYVFAVGGKQQSTNDIDFSTNAIGITLIDRTTATRYRLYIDNGVLLIEAV
jgi:hypothetical protein